MVDFKSPLKSPFFLGNIFNFDHPQNFPMGLCEIPPKKNSHDRFNVLTFIRYKQTKNIKTNKPAKIYF